jgi:hypothetical protein
MNKKIEVVEERYIIDKIERAGDEQRFVSFVPEIKVEKKDLTCTGEVLDNFEAGGIDTSALRQMWKEAFGVLKQIQDGDPRAFSIIVNVNIVKERNWEVGKRVTVSIE